MIGFVYFFLIYTIIGLLYANMNINIIKWAVETNRSRLDKRLLTLLTILYMTAFFPMMIYKVLKIDIEKSEKQIEQWRKGR